MTTPTEERELNAREDKELRARLHGQLDAWLDKVFEQHGTWQQNSIEFQVIDDSQYVEHPDDEDGEDVPYVEVGITVKRMVCDKGVG